MIKEGTFFVQNAPHFIAPKRTTTFSAPQPRKFLCPFFACKVPLLFTKHYCRVGTVLFPEEDHMQSTSLLKAIFEQIDG